MLHSNLVRTVVALIAIFFTLPASKAADPPVNEECWIVNSVGKDIAEMVLFADSKNIKKDLKIDSTDLSSKEVADTPHKFAYTLKWDASPSNQDREFILTEFVWSPENYAPWAKQLIEQTSLTPEPPSTASIEEMLTALADYDNAKFAQENKRVSTALSEHPLDANLHEQAALLCALLGLRESAACFNDARPALNRITAHLAMAKALRGNNDYNDAGKISEIALACLSGRDASALFLLDKMSSSSKSAAVAGWLRALKIRATRDYRIADLDKGCRIEKLEYGRALAEELGSDSVTDFLEKNKIAVDTAEWMRIGIRGIATVESGHVFTEPSLQVESADFVRDEQLFSGKVSKDSQEANAELSLRPTRCLTITPAPHLEPVSWNDMAAFHARHLLDSVWQKYYFERNYWGVQEEADATISWADKSFASIRLYPLVKLSVNWLKRAKQDDAVIANLTELLAKNPEDINCELWQRIEYCVPDKSKVPGPATWFVPQYPMGTAFDYNNRRFDKNPELTTEQLKALVDLAPHNEYLIYDWECAKYGTGKATEDQLKAAFGPLADIDIRSMQTIAEATENEPSKHIKSLQKIAQYKPDMYFKLGDYLVDQKRIDEAVKAYESGVEKARNAVLVANSSTWLVNYYYDHGQKEKALKLAQDAAEVYSAAGLLTLANLYERMGKFDDAEEYFQKENERYDEPSALCGFYKRNATAKPHYKSEADRMLKLIYPNGMVKVDFKALHEPPKNGAAIMETSVQADKYGLKAGDVFVAVDGYSVQNPHQYQYAADLNVGPDMEFIIWNGKEYRTVKAMLPSRRFGCAIKEFPAPK